VVIMQTVERACQLHNRSVSLVWRAIALTGAGMALILLLPFFGFERWLLGRIQAVVRGSTLVSGFLLWVYADLLDGSAHRMQAKVG
jgi:hypothetical protein